MSGELGVFKDHAGYVGYEVRTCFTGAGERFTLNRDYTNSRFSLILMSYGPGNDFQ